jgi:hypothetical protein
MMRFVFSFPNAKTKKRNFTNKVVLSIEGNIHLGSHLAFLKDKTFAKEQVLGKGIQYMTTAIRK